MAMVEDFNYDVPTVSEIKEEFKGRFVDLNRYSGLTHKDIAEAVLTKKQSYGLIIPRTFHFWDETASLNVQGHNIKLDSTPRFNKFGPSADMYRSSMSLKEARERNLLPIPAMKEAANSMDINVPYRGFGYWDLRTKEHKLIPFDVLAEGHTFSHFYGIRVRYQHGDVYCSYELPSASREGEGRRYEIFLRPLPTADPNILWTQTRGDCPCEDSVFREIRSKAKENGEFIDLFKYVRGEFDWCKHKYAAYEKALEESKKPGKKPILVQMFPKPKGFMIMWSNLKRDTIIADEAGRNAKRPLKTESRICLGSIIAYDPEKMFYW